MLTIQSQPAACRSSVANLAKPLFVVICHVVHGVPLFVSICLSFDFSSCLRVICHGLFTLGCS
ncbi:unnamed protein product [Linum tenue]|uniref:Uncharacterized protein n=1 Tax=Linum tenue TaxID=586396 RepID=A0AAV0M1N8_9ROSI|nr:unnamed protein product [Linum tenue]